MPFILPLGLSAYLVDQMDSAGIVAVESVDASNLRVFRRFRMWVLVVVNEDRTYWMSVPNLRCKLCGWHRRAEEPCRYQSDGCHLCQSQEAVRERELETNSRLLVMNYS